MYDSDVKRDVTSCASMTASASDPVSEAGESSYEANANASKFAPTRGRNPLVGEVCGHRRGEAPDRSGPVAPSAVGVGPGSRTQSHVSTAFETGRGCDAVDGRPLVRFIGRYARFRRRRAEGFRVGPSLPNSSLPCLWMGANRSRSRSKDGRLAAEESNERRMLCNVDEVVGNGEARN